MNKLTVIFKGGIAHDFLYEEEEYEFIYDAWDNGKEFMIFANGEAKTSEVVAIKWEA